MAAYLILAEYFLSDRNWILGNTKVK